MYFHVLILDHLMEGNKGHLSGRTTSLFEPSYFLLSNNLEAVLREWFCITAPTFGGVYDKMPNLCCNLIRSVLKCHWLYVFSVTYFENKAIVNHVNDTKSKVAPVDTTKSYTASKTHQCIKTESSHEMSLFSYPLYVHNTVELLLSSHRFLPTTRGK